MFRRKIYSELEDWKKTKAGDYALMIQGARRVGKSTIIEEFVKNEYESYIMVKFEKADDDIKDLFHHLDDLDRFFLHLQMFAGVQLKERRSAIVFDEVQLFPLARQSIKTLVEDGRYDYYETGPLISIKKNVQKILIPSEEDTIDMYPMDFEEFLWATGDEMTMPFIRDAFARMAPMGGSIHRKLMEIYRTYMIVGGMPQAVSAYIRDNSFESVERVKRSIIDLYLKDSAKLDGNTKYAKASTILRLLPSYLEKHDKTFSPGAVKKDSSMRDYRRIISDLEDSMMVNICYRVTEPAIDQMGHMDEDDLKIYMCDTGLLFTLSFGTSKLRKEEIYRAMIKGNTNVNNGMYFENMVAQELKMKGQGLFFSKFEVKGHNKAMEVDFIILRDWKPHPLEVKSGRIFRAHTSLDCFMDKYGQSTGEAFVAYSGDLMIEGGVTYIPIYMVSLL